MRHVLAEGRYDAPIFTDINTRFCSQMQRMDGPKAGSITPFAPVSKFPDVPSSFNSLVDNWEVVTIYEVKVKISAKGKHRQEHTVTRWDAVTWLNISLIRSKRCERAEFFKVVARWKGVDMESKTSNVVCYSINRSEETARELLSTFGLDLSRAGRLCTNTNNSSRHPKCRYETNALSSSHKSENHMSERSESFT